MERKPHVVIIMADQLRYDAIGRWTPNLCSLRRESVEFTRAYCASPLCVPARGSFFTGKAPNVTGSLNNAKIPQERKNGLVRKEHVTMYELMEREWDSWHTGKQNLYLENGWDRSPESRTHWLPMEGRYGPYLREQGQRQPGGPRFRTHVPEMAYAKVTRRAVCSLPETGCYEPGFDHFVDGFITRDTLHAIRSRDPAKPLLLNAMYFAPHPPLDIPEPWYSRVDGVELPDNVGVWGANQSPLQLYNLPGVTGGQYEREDWERIWRVYMGYVSLFDDCVGAVIDELKRQDLYDDSLIVFTSDHGEMLGSHRMWQKMCMYEESVRTPLFLKFPRRFQPSVMQVDEPVSGYDMLPTLCNYLGLEAPNGMNGLSLLPAVRGERLGREAVFVQYDGNGSLSNLQRCVIDGRYKLIVDLFKDETFLELYDLDADRQEMNNLAFEPELRPVAERLLDLLGRHMRDTNDLLSLPEHVYEGFIADYSEFKQ